MSLRAPGSRVAARTSRCASAARVALLAAAIAACWLHAAALAAAAGDPPAPAGPPRAPSTRPAPVIELPPGPREEAERDAREIRTTIEALHQALEQFFSDRKIGPVMAFYDDLTEYFSPSGSREGSSQIRRRLLSHAPRVKNFRTRVSPMTIRVSGNIAWATCDVHEEYTFDGRAGEEDLISTYVLERKPDGWRIVHEHQSLKLEGAGSDASPP